MQPVPSEPWVVCQALPSISWGLWGRRQEKWVTPASWSCLRDFGIIARQPSQHIGSQLPLGLCPEPSVDSHRLPLETHRTPEVGKSGQNIETGMEDSWVWRSQEAHFGAEGFAQGPSNTSRWDGWPALRFPQAFPSPGQLPRGSADQRISQEARKGVLGSIQRPTTWGEQEVKDFFFPKGRKHSGGCFHLACDDKIKN